MRKYIAILLLAVYSVIPIHAQNEDEIIMSIACTCNSATSTWISEYIIPKFEEFMREQGKTVYIELIDYDISDEAYREQTALDFSLSQGSDIVGFDGFWVPEFVNSDLIKPLNQVAGQQVDEWEGWDHIPGGVQAILTFEGERYGIPNGTDVRAIFYRRDIFESAGIELPWQPQSWNDILTVAQELKSSGVEIPLQIDAGTSMGEATTMQGFFMLILGAGHHLYDFETDKWIVSSPAISDVLNFYRTVYVDQSLGDVDLQIRETGRDESFAAFREGRIGIYIEGDWFWRSVLSLDNDFENRDDLVGWAMMPALESGTGYQGQDFVTISGGTGWTLNPNTPYPEESWQLLTFMTSKEAAQEFQYYEPSISFRDDVEVAGDEILTDLASALLPYTTVRPLLPVYPLVSLEVQLMVERVITGELNPEEAMSAYAEAITIIVGDDNVIIFE